jgi:hypothetical protein
MSDAKREETAARMLQRACSALESLFEETTDAAFGPNATVVHELNRSAGQYGLKFVVFAESKDLASARSAALEEAAKECDAYASEHYKPDTSAHYLSRTARECANRIRALKERP